MKNKIIFLLIVSALFSANVFAQKQNAVAFVDSFYKFQRTRTGVFNAKEIALHKKWFSAELNRLLQYELKREKEYLKKNPTDKPYFGDGLTFEPSDECFKMGKYYRHIKKIGATTRERNKTIVEVKFSNPKVCGGDFIDTYKVELIKNKGVWLINDWIYSDGKRLSDDLKRTEY